MLRNDVQHARDIEKAKIEVAKEAAVAKTRHLGGSVPVGADVSFAGGTAFVQVMIPVDVWTATNHTGHPHGTGTRVNADHVTAFVFRDDGQPEEPKAE